MANIYRVRAVSSGWVGAPGLNTFYFREGGGVLPGDNATAVLCAQRVQAAFTAGAQLWPTPWSVQVDPQVDVLNDVNGQLVSSQNGGALLPVGGTGGPNFGPTPTMHLLRLITSTVILGKRLRGRAFLGPTRASVDPDGSPEVTAMNFARAFGTALLDKGPTGPDVVVWHRPFAGNPLSVPPRPATAGSSGAVTSFLVPDKFAVLRSRRD